MKISVKVENEEGRVMFEEIVNNVPESYLFQQDAAPPVIDSVVLAPHRLAEQV